mgnify:CR=1 FL=1
MKKALSLILVLVMLLGMMPMQVFATEGTQETEAVEVVTEPTEAPEEETTAPTEATEPTEGDGDSENTAPTVPKPDIEIPVTTGWVLPIASYTYLSDAFGMRWHPIHKDYRMHYGVDLAAPTGTPIYATRAGTVTTASYQANGAGNYVSINHLDGFSSIYMHMTHYVVSKGQSVSQGQLIGYVGNTGISTGDHLHFGVSYAGTYVNPLAYIY